MREEDRERIAITTGSWVRGVLVLALGYFLYKVNHILLIIFASIVIASAVEPATVWAKKRGLPRLPTVIVVYVVTALLLAGFFYLLFLPLLAETADFVRTLPAYTDVVTSDVTPTSLVPSSVLPNLLGTFSLESLAGYINSLINSLSKGVFSSFSRVFGGVLSFGIIVVLSFYLAVQEDGVGKFLKIITPVKNEKYVVGLWKRSQHKIGLWMQGQLLLGVIVTVLSYLGLVLIGIPHALLLAVMAGIFELIPLFGPIISAIAAIFVAYAFEGGSTALIVAGLYLIIQQFENHLIYPLVVKKVVGVPPMVSILALLVGGQLGGFLGVLISVPLAAVLMEMLSDLEQRKIAQTENVG